MPRTPPHRGKQKSDNAKKGRRRPDGAFVVPPPPPPPPRGFRKFTVSVSQERCALLEQWAEEDGLTDEQLVQARVASMFSRGRKN